MAKRRRKKKLPQQELTTTINQLSHDGRGVAQIDGKTTFIFGALANENINFRYIKQNSRFDEGIASEIHVASPLRAKIKCPHFGVCGGCQLQHLSTKAQIQHKQKTFLELLQHQANIQPLELLAPLVSQPWGYRRKARFSVKYVPKKGKVLVGFRERGSSFVADLHQCQVLHPSIGEKISVLSDLLFQLHSREHIPQLEIAVGDNQSAIIVRHLESLDESDLNLLQTFAKKHCFYLYLQPKGIESIVLIYPKNTSPLLSYKLAQFDLKLEFHPAQFTQINHAINQQMIMLSLNLLELSPTDQVLDLFCGIGNFTLPIARWCHQVIGVEGEIRAIQQAKNNANLNHIKNTEFYCTNLFTDPSDQPWFARSYDKILLDPPRSGAKEILHYLPIWQAKRIVYVSCNPATLARDAKILTEQGYVLEKAGVMDMFPHTQHIEVICLFTLNS